MSDNISRELGKLQGEVVHMSKTIDHHTRLLEGMDAKLDGVVTRAEFDAHEKWGKAEFKKAEAKHESLAARVGTLEQRAALEDSSQWTKIKNGVGEKFTQFIVLAIFAICGTLLVQVWMQQNDNSVPVVEFKRHQEGS